MNNDELNDLLRAGLLRRAQQDADAHRDQPVPEPSHAYRRWERKFLAAPFGWARRAVRPVWRRAVCSAAAILLVVSCSFTASRAWGQRIMVQDYGEYDALTFAVDEDELTGEMGAWYPTWIPEGYELTDDTQFYALASLTYKNEMGQEIDLTYAFASDQILYIDNEHHTKSRVSINGEDGIFLQGETKEYHNFLVWTDPSSNIVFSLDGFLSKPELIRIAESISQK